MLKTLVLFLLSTRFSDYRVTHETEFDIKLFKGDENGVYDEQYLTIRDGTLFFECCCVTKDDVIGREWFSEYDYSCPASEEGIKALYADWDAAKAEDDYMAKMEAERIAAMTPEQLQAEQAATRKMWANEYLS